MHAAVHENCESTHLQLALEGGEERLYAPLDVLHAVRCRHHHHAEAQHAVRQPRAAVNRVAKLLGRGGALLCQTRFAKAVSG